MALCAKCKASSRDVRHAFYKALVASGAEQCPACRDYVSMATHVCPSYQTFRDYGIQTPVEAAA